MEHLLMKYSKEKQLEMQKPLINLLVEVIRHDCRKLESRSDELWDKSAPYMQENPDLEERWVLLKNLKLKDCHFESPAIAEDTEYPYFTIVGKNNEPLFISNRDSNRNELRGTRLKEALKERQKTHPDETLYDALKIIAIQKFSMAEKFRKTATNQETMGDPPVSSSTVVAMSDLHYTLFTSALMQEMLHAESSQNTSIDAAAIYQKTFQLTEQIDHSINEIHLKQKDMVKRNENAIGDLLTHLDVQLKIEKSRLFSGKINVSQFAVNCEKHIGEIEENKQLHEQRKPLGKIQARSTKLLSNYGLSKESKPSTNDTMKKINTLKRTLSDLKQLTTSNNSENEESMNP